MAAFSVEELAALEPLQDIPAEELGWLCEHGEEQRLEIGEFFTREGETVGCFYLTVEGELQVTRTVNGEEIVLGTTPPGVIGGELALLNNTPSLIAARAILRSRLLTLDEHGFRELFAACPAFSSHVFQIASQRSQSFALLQTRQERLAALGKFSAGLAHELNNPAAAVVRATDCLLEALPLLQAETLQLGAMGLEKALMESLLSFQRNAMQFAAHPEPISTVERMDREEAIATWLEDQGLQEVWEMAANFVSAGVVVDDLQGLAAALPEDLFGALLSWANNSLYTAGLLGEISAGGARISELVGAVKAYTYMDQGPVQKIDIHHGLENTLLIMKHELHSIKVIKEFDPNLPHVTGRGGELNIVWTNLIDNAIDALEGKGELRLITRCENDYVMVEVADNGPGIPAEVFPRLFEPFVTTKKVGAGSGLGLDTVYRIVKDHHGSIDVQSEPGNTRFIVRLPVKAE